jgi:hypothetical protein
MSAEATRRCQRPYFSQGLPYQWKFFSSALVLLLVFCLTMGLPLLPPALWKGQMVSPFVLEIPFPRSSASAVRLFSCLFCWLPPWLTPCRAFPKFRMLVDLFSKSVLEAVLLRPLSAPSIFVRRSTFTADICKILIHFSDGNGGPCFLQGVSLY